MLKTFLNWIGKKGLPNRPDIKDDIVTNNNANIIDVICVIKEMEPLAHVTKVKYRKSKLQLTISKYLISPAILNPEHKINQLLEVILHELMHVVLWNNMQITHSEDKKSLLYPLSSGDNLEPTEWDLKVMLEASQTIDEIRIDLGKIKYHLEPAHVITMAAASWNRWLGKPIFKIL
jgi:hypothetical protein